MHRCRYVYTVASSENRDENAEKRGLRTWAEVFSISSALSGDVVWATVVHKYMDTQIYRYKYI